MYFTRTLLHCQSAVRANGAAKGMGAFPFTRGEISALATCYADLPDGKGIL